MATSIGEKFDSHARRAGLLYAISLSKPAFRWRYLEAIDRTTIAGCRAASSIAVYSCLRETHRLRRAGALEEYSTMMHERGESTDEVSRGQARSLVYTDNGGKRSPLMTLLLLVIILAVSVLRRLGGVVFLRAQNQTEDAGAGPCESRGLPRAGVDCDSKILLCWLSRESGNGEIQRRTRTNPLPKAWIVRSCISAQRAWARAIWQDRSERFPKRPARMRVRAILFVKGATLRRFIKADEVYSIRGVIIQKL